ncbi:MAG: hypothetical protein ACRYFX_04570 [Janthinobacterium lividum]
MDITKATTRQERGACFHTHMHAVAAALDGFVYKPLIEAEPVDWLASGELISGKERTTLYVTLHLGDYNEKTPYRADCCGVYPRTAKGENYPNCGDPRPNIKFQLTRPAAQIAGDIQRRLLPDYKTFFAQVARWVQVKDTAAATLAATLDVLKEAGFTFPKDSNEGQMLFARGEKLEYPRPSVYVYGNSVDLKLKNLTPAKVLAVLEVLDLTPAPAYV